MPTGQGTALIVVLATIFFLSTAVSAELYDSFGDTRRRWLYSHLMIAVDFHEFRAGWLIVGRRSRHDDGGILSSRFRRFIFDCLTGTIKARGFDRRFSFSSISALAGRRRSGLGRYVGGVRPSSLFRRA